MCNLLLGFSLPILIRASVGGPIVTISTGQIEGQYLTTPGGKQVAEYLGIAFAAPPVGSLRFKKPERAKSWNNVRKGDSFGPACPQPPSTVPSGVSMDEDCLYLNVYVPRSQNASNFPVMVFIHGGGFNSDTGASYKFPGNLVNKGVILVTINYRLDALGFFTTNTSEFPANLAMYDQLHALNWVQEEISNFGGNPSKVTIFGESAGGGSVSLLTYSPLAKGLFSGAIMESGTAFSPWAVEGNSNYRYNSSRDLAISLNCTTHEKWLKQDFDVIGNCLRSFSWQKLWNASFTILIKKSPLIVWGPSVDGKGNFLPAMPINLAATRSKDLPVMIGTNANEAATSPFVSQLLYGAANLSSFTNEPTFNLFRDFTATTAEFKSNTGIVREFLTSSYIGWNTPLLEKMPILWLESTVQMMSDKIAFATSRKEAELWLENGNSNVYLYSFDYVSDGFPYSQGYKPVFHAEELMFLFPGFFKEVFGSANKPFIFTPRDTVISEYFGIMWTNFAKTGDPNQPMSLTKTWELAGTPKEMSYYSIDTNFKMKEGYRKKGGRIWNELMPKINSHECPLPSSGSYTTSLRIETTIAVFSLFQLFRY